MRPQNTNDKDQTRMQNYRILDDVYMNLFFDEDVEVTELVLRKILKTPDLKVQEVHVQQVFENPRGRGAKLDVYATDGSGNKYDIEMQRDSEDAHPKRARFYSSLMDTKMLEPQQKFEEMKDSYVIFITELDVRGGGQLLYHYETINAQNGEYFNDGRHIIYLNASFEDDSSELGKLVHDICCSNPDDMYYKVLADKARYLKENEEGIDKMKSASEELREEGREEVAMNLIDMGLMSFEKISEATGLPIEKIEELARNKAS